MSKNKLFEVFDNVNSNQWRNHLHIQSQLLKGIECDNYEFLNHIRNLLILLFNDYAREITDTRKHPYNKAIHKKYRLKDLRKTELNRDLVFLGTGPIMRHAFQIAFFKDEQWKLTFVYLDKEVVYEGGQTYFVERYEEIEAHFASMLHEAFKNYGGMQKIKFQTLVSGKLRQSYEQDLREYLKRNRTNYTEKILTFYDNYDKNSLNAGVAAGVFRHFGIVDTGSNLPLLLSPFTLEKLMDLSQNLSIVKDQLFQNSNIFQRVNQEWTESVENIWKKHTREL